MFPNQKQNIWQRYVALSAPWRLHEEQVAIDASRCESRPEQHPCTRARTPARPQKLFLLKVRAGKDLCPHRLESPQD